jgi:CDP-paratose 2-epimerase
VGGGAANAISLRDCTALCADITGTRLDIGADANDRPGDIKVYVTDHTRLSSITGWIPRRNTQRLFEDSFTWLRQHEERLRVIMGQ